MVKRFLNADVFTSTGQGFLGYNMFAYCNNNPVANLDPSGEILITTAILIGSAILGGVTALYTGYKMREAGADWADTVFYAGGAGCAAFCTVYSLGTSAYAYYSFASTYYGYTPVTEIGGSTSVGDVEQQLQICADTADASIGGNGSVVGTLKHTALKNEVDALGIPNLQTEISYRGGEIVPYGTSGSVHFDVIYYNNQGQPVQAWDFKTGGAVLTSARIAAMQAKAGLPGLPIHELRGGR